MNPLPSNPDAERSILGAILLDNEIIFQADGIQAEDFSLASHRKVFAAMAALAEDKKPIDYITLADELKSRKENRSTELEAIGGVAYLSSLTDGAVTANIQHYIKIISEHSRKRKLMNILQSACAEVCEEGCKSSTIISKIGRQILDIGEQRNGPKHIAEIIGEVNEDIEKLQAVDIEKETIGYRTGLRQLDEITSGYRKREYTIIAAWTSDGKTSLLKQGVLAQAFDNVPCVVFSREVSRQQLILDLKRYMARIDPRHTRDPRMMTMFERQEFKRVDKEMRKWPVWVDDSRNLHIDEVARRTRRLIRHDGTTKPPEILFLDYIGLFRGEGKTDTEVTNYISEVLWNIADECNIPVVALSQLSRDREKKKRRPMLMDLKQSGRLEQDAHNVIFCYRPENDHGYTRNDELIVAKQRHGKKAVLKVEFDENELVYIHREKEYV